MVAVPLMRHKTHRVIINMHASFVMKSFQATMLYQHTNVMFTEPTNLVEILLIVFTKLDATSAMSLSP